jgi:xanthine dehydrogenase accessory factor
MRDILDRLTEWLAAGERVALATVVQTWGSSPRRVGAKMAVTTDGKIAGSVSGGCVENAVVETALGILKGRPAELLHFGVADETAWQVGLACGGSIDVFVQALNKDMFAKLHSVLTSHTRAAHLTILRGPGNLAGRELLLDANGVVATTLEPSFDPRLTDLAQAALNSPISSRQELDGTLEVFTEILLAPPALVLVGGAHIAVALAGLAKALGFRTVVVDPRRTWASDERFPGADQLIPAWPDEAFEKIGLNSSTAVATLTHDPKLDDPALILALQSDAFYIGALGSKSTQARRRARLQQAGLSDSQLARLHAPIGLDLGAETPEEIALSIMAQVLKEYRTQPAAQPTQAPVAHH